jgi:hypothetical protein
MFPPSDRHTPIYVNFVYEVKPYRKLFSRGAAGAKVVVFAPGTMAQSLVLVMRERRLLNLAVALSALLLVLAAARHVEAASAGPTVTVYQSPT